MQLQTWIVAEVQVCIRCTVAKFFTLTMQTAVGVFGSEGYTDRMDAVPLMVANAGNSDRPAISSLDCPPIVAVELCREHLVVDAERKGDCYCHTQWILVSRTKCIWQRL
ncbi:phosphoglycerate mutase-like protein 1 isoform X1 [Actinidia eriantha]|uniref:phosphoglycerate mutase-like protein 1 isoform X1 n=1 Tax=Actinidia eriantha TaxID=165200 RepID=UPI0025899454|nr:phosphoglycerate mutase-like protein 1 isoform X1 [Actinidia eriantha]